ncbi:MAG: hypothetical protein LUC83_02850 [Clostridiales bacterium]|nr:hypothetical protein [Clostridiales bacterium]
MRSYKGDQNINKIQELSDYIDRSRNMVAITGAGISLAGGGVTYRQLSRTIRPGGLHSKSFLHSYVDAMHHYKPTYSHYALRDLEAEGKLAGIITTNEDCMHTIAGSQNVAEIQGSFQINRCSKCGRHYDGYEIWNRDDLPRCESCGGTILPWELYSHIGLWEEGVQKARQWISKADLILVIGTNGYYGSAYWDYRRHDAVIVQINPGHTGFDRVANLNIREACDDVFQKLREIRENDC